MATRVHLNKKNINLLKKKGSKGVTGPPPANGGGMRATPLPPFFFFLFCFLFLIFFFKKISIFIYFLINLYYFIKMDMSAPRVANKRATRGADVAFDRIC
jgi:hypothetical protein